MAKIRRYEPEAATLTELDLALLLRELDQLLNTIARLGPGHRSRENLLERTFLLWQLELERFGAIEFRREGQGFYHDEFGTIDCVYLGDLVRAMEIHLVESVRVTAGFDQEGFSRFMILLALPTANLDRMCEGLFAGRLYASSGPGIEVNGRARERDVREPEASMPAPGAPAELQPPQTQATQATFPSLEEDPFEAPAMAMPGEHLRLCLRELDRCREDLQYEALIDKILGWAQELWNANQREEIYRALLVLTAHASATEDVDRTRTAMAQSALESLVESPQLEFLIERVCDCETGGVKATQVLLQLGERPTPALLDALDREPDRARSKRLASTVLALGEFAVPALIEAIAKRSGGRLQLVVRLAGELQSPKMVPILANIFHDSGPALRKEAGMALVNIGNEEASSALVRGLERDNQDLMCTAALCLGVMGDDSAAGALRAALERARERGYDPLAQAIVRSLAQLGHEIAV